MITKIISGGQTGADRGGLDAAIACRLPHGGWCPKGRTAEDGIISAKYHLCEMASSKYLARTQANVFDSDATVIFTHGPLSGGSLHTVTYAHHLEKPYHPINLARTTRAQAVHQLLCWLAGETRYTDHDEYLASPPPSCILNVAGSRESHAPGIHDAVFHLMMDLLMQVNPACKQLHRLGDPNAE